MWPTGVDVVAVVAETITTAAVVVLAAAMVGAAMATPPPTRTSRAKVGATTATLHDVAATRDLHRDLNARFA
jgi:Ser/Thr protein kinase RdoA (MazF antagonist)